jgi:uroporphyrinogen-III synthase
MITRAIVTRPKKVYQIDEIEGRGKVSLLEELEARGLLSQVPTIKLQIIPAAPEVREFFEKSFFIILSSPSGIFFFKETLQSLYGDFALVKQYMKNKMVGLIGKVSRDAFHFFFGECRQVIHPPQGNENAKALAEILIQRFGQEKGFNANSARDLIFLPRGDIGTFNWQEMLKPLTNLEIKESIIYRNVPDYGKQQELSGRKGLETDWFFFSPSAIDALVTITGSVPEQEPWNAWCIGKTTEKEASKYKFRNIYTATSAKEEALLAEYMAKQQGKG